MSWKIVKRRFRYTATEPSTSTMSCIHSPEDGSLSISRPCIRDIRKLILRSTCARCSKKNHWDTAVADAILDSYCSVRSLDDTSMRLLQALLLFPEKFCKLCNHYSNSRKSWVCDRDVDKLAQLIQLSGEREEYLHALQAIV